MIPVSTVLVLSVSGCGADEVRGRAREAAFDTVRENVDATITCLTSLAPGLSHEHDTKAFAQELSSCAGTSILNEDDAVILANGFQPSDLGTVAVSSSWTAERLTLELSTVGTGRAAVGVTQASAVAITCWQAFVDLDTGMIDDLSGATCSGGVTEQVNPTEEVEFEDLELLDP